MKTLHFGLFQYLALLATGIVVSVFVMTRAVDIEQHNQRIDLLLELQKTEGEMDRRILMTTSFLLTQYDDFVTLNHTLRELLNQLRTDESWLSESDDVVFSQTFDAYKNDIQRKKQLSEQLKSYAALVRNGLHYLPLPISELYESAPSTSKNLMVRLNQLYRYTLFPGTLESREILHGLEQFSNTGKLTPDDQVLVSNILQHIRAVFRYIEQMQLLRDEYMAVTSKEKLERLHKAYVDYFSAGTRSSTYFSYLLLVLSVFLFASLGYAMWHLSLARQQSERSWNQLREAVESLSEAFALFSPQGRLILCNSRYRDLYPWLQNILLPGARWTDIYKAHCNSQHFTSDKHFPTLSFPCSDSRNYVERLSGERYYLASDSCTSAGELACVRIDITETKRTEHELRKLYRAVNQSPASVIITDTKGTIEYVNPKFEQVTGYTAKEAIGQNPRILKTGDKTKQEYQELWKTITSGNVWQGQFHNCRKNGTTYWETASISPIRDEDGLITHFLAVKEDITSRKLAEEQLRMNAKVFETTSEAIIVTDKNNRIKTVNPAFVHITGYTPPEVIGKQPQFLKSGRHDDAFYRQMWDTLQTKGSWSGEIWNRRKNGEIYPEWLSIVVIRDSDGQVQEHVAVFSDITRRKQDEEQIRRQANYDALTHLPNRVLLVDRLQNALKSARRECWHMALLFIDLDRFKAVNDSLGHVVGDELLKQVALRLQASLREMDTVARFGGDEFVVILEDIGHAKDAADVCKKIIASLSHPFLLHEREVFIGASIGVTLYPDDSSDPDSMLRNADMAMYRAKDAGRNNFQFFTEAMNEQVQKSIDLERGLRRAIEEQQLELYYQPLIRLSDGKMIGVESLIRWNHPQQGLISPGEFIPLAEETGLIASLGKWVLEAAAIQAAIWNHNGVSLKVNVNLSSKQLVLGLTVEDILLILKRHKVKPEWICLEITESMMLENNANNLSWLESAADLGLHFAIDDFGTGYSSLSYLKRFPVTTLKIDREFIEDLPSDNEGVSLVHAIIAMAQALNLSIVAEGIETRQQQEFLHNAGCNTGQGYLFSKPVHKDRIPALVKHFNAR